MTRKLTIRTKLAAALAVPLIALTAFAAFQVRGSFDTADRVKRQADLATSATGPAGIVNALENERNFESLRAIGFERAVPLPVTSDAQAKRETDTSVAKFKQLLGTLSPDASTNYSPVVGTVEGGLQSLRSRANTLAVNASLDHAAGASDLFGDYTSMISDLLDANARVALPIDDAKLRSGVEMLDALARENDLEARLIREAGVASVLKDADGALQTRRLSGAVEEGDSRLRVLADGEYQSAVLPVLDNPARRKYLDALQATTKDPEKVDFQGLLGQVPKGSAQLTAAEVNVGRLVTARAAKLTDDAKTQERNFAAAALGSVLLAILILFLANRWITRPLRRLADEATDMASERLPVAVKEILDSPPNEEIPHPQLPAVAVKAGGEVGEVATALNHVQDSAIDLAVEQAVLRRGVADAYINLGRRNQNLLDRQLEFISQLEREESDPEALDHLFKLDHLATRMRRNAESLLVLAGLDPPRKWSAPVDLGDVVRGALGEVEGYQRVRLRNVDPATVDGSAAADISHAVAELVENALTFSPPDAEVDVFGRLLPEGYVLTIVDYGIGMSPEEIERANERISSYESFRIAPSRYLGHYVVAQLAARHGLQVHLTESPAGGLTAMMLVPPKLLSTELRTADTPPAVHLDDEAGAPVARAVPDLVPYDVEADEEAELPHRLAALEPEPSDPYAELAHLGDDDSLDESPFFGGEEGGADQRGGGAGVDPSSREEAEGDADRDPSSGAVPVAGPVQDEGHEPQREFAIGLVPPTSLWDGESWDEARAVEHDAAEPEPERHDEPDTVIVAEVVAEPEPATEPETEPGAQPEPVPAPEASPARSRLAFGAFSDLHNVAPTPAPAPEAPAVIEPAPAIAVDAPAEPVPAHPELAVPSADHRAAFAEVAQAVGAIAQAPAAHAVEPPATTWSEDFIPQRLPKRGRRSSRLQTPWVRGKGAGPAEAGQDATSDMTASSAGTFATAPGASASAVAGVPPLGPPAAASTFVNEAGAVSGVTPAAPSGQPGAMRIGPELPTREPGRAMPASEPSHFAHGTNGETSAPGDAAAPTADGANGADQRFAFFAAFRAAAERAREEAGIDTRRIGR